MISRVTNYDGRVIDDFQPEVADVIPAGVARIMVSMLREVINSGTSTKAKELKRPLAGKTGTTNDFTDAWFIGFSPHLTCGVYVGFDDHRTLGPKEEGARVALPIWMDFMGQMLKDQPVEDFPNSPLLTNSAQVKEIIANAEGGEVLVNANNAPAAGPPGPAGDSPAAPKAMSIAPAKSGVETKPSPNPPNPPAAKPAPAKPAPVAQNQPPPASP